MNAVEHSHRRGALSQERTLHVPVLRARDLGPEGGGATDLTGHHPMVFAASGDPVGRGASEATPLPGFSGPTRLRAALALLAPSQQILSSEQCPPLRVLVPPGYAQTMRSFLLWYCPVVGLMGAVCLILSRVDC